MKARVILALALVLLGSSSIFPMFGIQALAFRTATSPNRGQDSQESTSGQVPGTAFKVATVNVGLLPTSSSVDTSLPTTNPMTHLRPAGRGSSSPISAMKLASTGSSTESIVSGFDGINQVQDNAVRLGCCVPPDLPLAVGPNHIVQMVNLVGEVFTKQGAVVETFPLQSLFGPSLVSDPKVIYDSLSGRWFASIIAFSSKNGGTFNVTLAVSTTSDPTGVWNLYGVTANAFLDDQPLLGISSDKLVVSVNEYGGPQTTFVGANYWVLNKSEMVNGAATADFVSIGPNINYESIYPVKSLSASTTQYMVSVGGGDLGVGSSTVQLFSITGVPPATVSVSTVSLSTSPITQPPDASQLGTTSLVATNDYRVLDASWYQGKLWYSLNDGCTFSGNPTLFSCARITEINTSTTSVVQDFDLGSVGFYYFFPALSVDNKGDLAIIYGYSSATNSTCCYPSLAVTGQAASDPVNSAARPVILRVGSAPDTTDQFTSGGRPRYGDYFGAAVDPSNPSLVWVIGEYHNVAAGNCWSGNCWSTAIASITDQTGLAMSASPSYLDMPSSSSATSKISILGLGGLTGTVSLSASVSKSGPTATLSPSSVSMPPSSQTSTLNVTVPSTVKSGTIFTVNVTGRSGSFSTSTIVTVAVGYSADFSVAPTSGVVELVFSVPVGGSASSTLTLASLNGFNGTVTLSGVSTPSSGPSFTFPFGLVFLRPSWSVPALVTVTATYPMSTGLYSGTITATSGSISHSVSVNIFVTGITFSLAHSETFTGVTVTTSGSVSVDSPSSVWPTTVSGTATEVATNSTTGTTLFSTTYTISKLYLQLHADGSYTREFMLNVSVSPYPLATYAQLAVSVPSSTSPGVPSSSFFVARNADLSMSGQVDLNDVSIVHARYGCSLGQPCYNPRWDLAAHGIIDNASVAIVDGAYGANDYNLYLYTLTSNPSSLTIPQGTVGTSTVSISTSSFSNFAGTDTLSSSGPTGISSTLNPGTITVSGTSILTITVGSTTLPGNYTITVMGTSGLRTLSTTITVMVPTQASDFTISASSNPLSVRVGSSATSTLTLSSLAGFSGTVSLTSSTSYSGLTVSLTPTSVRLSSGGTGTSVLTASSSTNGAFTVSVTGTSGALSHTISLTVYVGDFLFTADPTSVQFKAGSQSSVYLEAFSINAGMNVSLTRTVNKAGLTATLSTSLLVVTPGGVPTTFLTLTSNTQGFYTVTVTGTSGSLVHSIPISVQVCPSSGCRGILSPSPVSANISFTGVLELIDRQAKLLDDRRKT